MKPQMPDQDLRRHRRRPLTGRVRLLWDDGQGSSTFASGTCLDYSESGLRIEIPIPIPVGTTITVSADRINLIAVATVKHLVRQDLLYVVGVELSEAMHSKTMVAIRGA